MYNKRRLRIFRSVVNKFIHEGIFLMLLDILNFIFFLFGCLHRSRCSVLNSIFLQYVSI